MMAPMQRDQLAGQTRRFILSGLVSIAATVPGGGIAAAKKGGNGKSKGKGNDKQKGKAKVALCHNAGTPQQHTIVVSEPAVEAHVAHGDTLGACPS